MRQTLSGRLATHCGGWTGCEAGCQHGPSWTELRTATIMKKASVVQEARNRTYVGIYGAIERKSSRDVEKQEHAMWDGPASPPFIDSDKKGWTSLHSILPQPSLSLLITFPLKWMLMCVWVCVQRERERMKGRGVCFQGQSVCGGCGALEIAGYLICNLISMARPFRGLSQSDFLLWQGWCVCLSVSPQQEVKYLRGTTQSLCPFPLWGIIGVSEWISYGEWSQLDSEESRETVSEEEIGSYSSRSNKHAFFLLTQQATTTSTYIENMALKLCLFFRTPKSKHQSACRWLSV